MIRLIVISLAFLVSFQAYGQSTDSLSTDSLLQDRWKLSKIIDIMTGSEILPTHKSNKPYLYYIEFYNGEVSFNLEINTCGNSYKITNKNEIEFEFYNTCTKICCDSDFSALLNYDSCTKFFIKNINTLVLISDERIYYFKRSGINSEE